MNADHLSAGGEDAVLVAAQENEGNQSVPGNVTGPPTAEDTTPYEIGTTPADACHDPSSSVSQQEAEDTLAAHGFCNMLVYHDNASTPTNTTNITHVSKPDQHYPDDSPITQFDVIRTHTYSIGVSTCYPFCPPRDTQPTGGQALFNITHELTHFAKVTDDPRTANEKEASERSQSYGVSLAARGYGGLTQDTAGIWEMNGWWEPAALTSFVAYIYEDDQPVDKERLVEIVGDETTTGSLENDLHEGTEPTVCGYTPDFVFTTVSPGAAGLNCEFEFEEAHASGDNDQKFDGYDDECDSPAYFCSQANEDAWYFQTCVCLGLTDPETPGFDNIPNPELAVNDDGSTFAGPEGQTDYIRWHFVVAPHNSVCGGAQEPGFSFTPGDANTLPYLAHDLDVYTTAGSVDGVGGGVPEVFDYADAIAEEQTAKIGPTIEDAQKQVDDTIAGLPAIPSNVGENVSKVHKDDQLEPNDDTSSLSVDDTSRSWENGALFLDGATSVEDTDLYRDLEGDCASLFSVEEDPDNADPWVDYIDSEAIAAQDAQVDLTYRSDERIDFRTDLYNNTDASQDDDNRPGPSLYTTAGKVGFFTDTDNDGEYDQNEAGVKYNPGAIRERGAYPMMWNMWVKENDNGNPVVDTDEGCTLGADDQTTMPEQMQELGYTANTSLVQAVYLKEPTAFQAAAADPADPAPVATYPAGNNIYLMMSQAARQLWNGTAPAELNTTDNPVDGEIDSLLKDLETYADDQDPRELGLSGDVYVPGAELGIEAAFTDQCSDHTGNFENALQFLHHCAADCSGDTVVTMYTFELQGDDRTTLSGSAILPDFSPKTDPFEFDASDQHTWYDVDPFDNDPARNQDSGDPDQKETDPGYLGEGLFN